MRENSYTISKEDLKQIIRSEVRAAIIEARPPTDPYADIPKKVRINQLVTLAAKFGFKVSVSQIYLKIRSGEIKPIPGVTPALLSKDEVKRIIENRII